MKQESQNPASSQQHKLTQKRTGDEDVRAAGDKGDLPATVLAFEQQQRVVRMRHRRLERAEQQQQVPDRCVRSGLREKRQQN